MRTMGKYLKLVAQTWGEKLKVWVTMTTCVRLLPHVSVDVCKRNQGFTVKGLNPGVTNHRLFSFA